MKINNENNIGIKTVWETSSNLIKIRQIDASELILSNDETQSSIALADLKLFKT
jgi:hypothetical protein